MKEDRLNEGKVSVEHLSHFQCGACERWWSIGDIAAGQKDASFVNEMWFCPWCGLKQKVRVSDVS